MLPSGAKVRAPNDVKVVVLNGRAVEFVYKGELGSGLFAVPEE